MPFQNQQEADEFARAVRRASSYARHSLGEAGHSIVPGSPDRSALVVGARAVLPDCVPELDALARLTTLGPVVWGHALGLTEVEARLLLVANADEAVSLIGSIPVESHGARRTALRRLT